MRRTRSETAGRIVAQLLFWEPATETEILRRWRDFGGVGWELATVRRGLGWLLRRQHVVPGPGRTWTLTDLGESEIAAYARGIQAEIRHPDDTPSPDLLVRASGME